MNVMHEFEETFHSVTFYFMKKLNFLTLAGSVFCSKITRAVNRLQLSVLVNSHQR